MTGPAIFKKILGVNDLACYSDVFHIDHSMSWLRYHFIKLLLICMQAKSICMSPIIPQSANINRGPIVCNGSGASIRYVNPPATNPYFWYKKAANCSLVAHYINSYFGNYYSCSASIY